MTHERRETLFSFIVALNEVECLRGVVSGGYFYLKTTYFHEHMLHIIFRLNALNFELFILREK